MSEHLKSNHTFEKTLATYKTAPDPESISFIEMRKTMKEITKIELEGIANYFEQIARYVDSFGMQELPYILAGMNRFIEVMLNAPGVDKELLKQKYDDCVMIAKKFLASTLIMQKKGGEE